ncbi:unnamed protein product (macronuclear) [Paramecium tetraurelia]|uniref:Amino acid transporter transmembrane domain-containing protein n=1 Tax=Paramecium tetraurelia TaxID=5888 RepID=A0E4D1_PARTE|nr:uncharacterized protein GSPATT00023322001 [Paramecium tetraurelia]CAK90148.1 unnamed protein product [Paramecium tetraurelia]|eukprot:XP_001457545.1 hypothetical protein (macronuclear) [Paramecium tetraurelia strain d4-2]
MFISAPGCVFMTYLGFMIAIGSETVYVVPHSRIEGAFALFITAVLYAIFFAISYNSEYSQVQRQQNVDEWINSQEIREAEMELQNLPKQQPTEQQSEDFQ